MTKVQQEHQGIDTIAISNAFTDYLNDTGKTLNEVAALLSTDTKVVTPRTLSEMKNHQKGGTSGVWRKLRNLVSPYLNNGIIETSDFAMGMKYAQYARKNNRMIAILGDTGVGKSTIKDALMLQPNTYSFYVDDTSTPGVFLRDIIRNIGRWYDGTQNELLARVADELNMLPNPLLIIDECAKMSDKLMLLLHSLRDKTMKNCGIVLMGMPDFKTKIDKHVRKGTIGYAEFNRRINMWYKLDGLTRSEIAYVLDYNDIDKAVHADFMGYKRFGDLMNAIEEYHVNNED